MPIVYKFIPKEKMPDVMRFGMKMSVFKDDEDIVLDGQEKQNIMIAYLNPRDRMDLLQDKHQVCVKLEIDEKTLMIREGFAKGFRAKDGSDIRASICEYNDYRLGMFRMPQVMIVKTVMPEQISMYDHRRDMPLLYSNSEEIYLNNLLSCFMEEGVLAKDAMLFSYLLMQHKQKKVKIKLSEDKKSILFIDNQKQIYKIRVPKG